MCLISYLKEGTDKYNDKVISFIRKGATTNDDGSGYMFKRKGDKKIVVDKGYFTIDHMIDALKAQDLKPEDELVIHHRTSTAGKVSAENSHPFVISDNHNIVSATTITTKQPCMVHNGVFTGLYNYMKLNYDFSDTYAFARYILGNKHMMKLLDENEELFKFLTDDIVNTSRMVIMYPDKPTKLIGDFITDSGYMHSNACYRSYSHYDRGGSSFGHSPGACSVYARDFSEGYDHYDGHFNDWFEREEHLAAETRPANNEILPKPHNDSNLGEGMGKIGSTSQGLFQKTTWFKCKPIKMVMKMVLLDKTMVEIDEDNFKHFYYISKEDFKTGLALNDFKVAEILQFNNSQAKISLRYEDESSTDSVLITNYHTVHWTELRDNYYYIAKQGWVDIYSDYIKLVLDTYNRIIGAKTLKKVENKLKNAYRKDWQDRIKCQRLGKKTSVTKGSLILFQAYLKKELSNHLAMKQAKKDIANDIEHQNRLAVEETLKELENHNINRSVEESEINRILGYEEEPFAAS